MLGQIAESILALVRVNRVTAIFVALAIPVLVALLATYYDPLMKIEWFLFWIPAGTLIVFSVFVTYLAVDVKLAPEFYLECEANSKKIEKLEADIVYLTLLQEHILAWNAIVRPRVSVPRLTFCFLEVRFR